MEDWLHFNSLAYNKELDQIMISNRNLNEIYIIDHSTTTKEAASSSGGRWGKGGDLLFRWGNAQAFAMGSAAERKLHRQHHAHWIEKGLPGENKIMIFNNGLEREPEYSTVLTIDPPKDQDGKYFKADRYLPLVPEIVYEDSTHFFSRNVSSAQRLANGNTLIGEGAQGRFFEINADKRIVWQYINPVCEKGGVKQGSKPENNQVFRCNFYSISYRGLKGRKLKPRGPLESEPLINRCKKRY
jgi:hypothetical protein